MTHDSTRDGESRSAQFDGAPVDWSKPIEAVHDDGRVISATLDGTKPDDPLATRLVKSDFGLPQQVYYLWFKENGDMSFPLSENESFWRIRNVEPPRSAQDVARDAAKAAGGAFVPWMTHSEWLEALTDADTSSNLAKNLGIIRPDPTPAERIHEQHPHIALANIEAVLAASADL